MEENIKKTKIVVLAITGIILFGFFFYVIYYYYETGKILLYEVNPEITYMIFFFIFLPFVISLIDYIIFKFRSSN
jgi:hypothetical protein